MNQNQPPLEISEEARKAELDIVQQECENDPVYRNSLLKDGYIGRVIQIAINQSRAADREAIQMLQQALESAEMSDEGLKSHLLLNQCKELKETIAEKDRQIEDLKQQRNKAALQERQKYIPQLVKKEKRIQELEQKVNTWSSRSTAHMQNADAKQLAINQLETQILALWEALSLTMNTLKNAVATFRHDHWDNTMQHGKGCNVCISQSVVKDQFRQTLEMFEALSSTPAPSGWVKREPMQKAVCCHTGAG